MGNFASVQIGFVLHIFVLLVNIFLTAEHAETAEIRGNIFDRIAGFLGNFSRSCVLGKGFSRCEHLAKPFAFDHGHLLWPKYTIRPAKKDFLLDIDLQEFTKILIPPGLLFISMFS